MRASLCLTALVVLVATACAPALSPLPFEPAGKDEQGLDHAPNPAEFGPFPVGVRTVTYTDPSRLNPTKDGPRELKTEIWYPAVASARAGPFVKYVMFDELPEDLRGTLKPEDLGELPTQAVRDAPVRDDRGPFPVIIFSHGNGGIRIQSTYYTVFLASHGYVVVSPDHQGNTIVDLLRAKDVKVDSSAQAFVDRPIDASFLIDQLEATPKTDPLFGHMDIKRLGMTGHSFGALTSFVTAGNDPRVRAIVGQSPAGVGLIQFGTNKPIEKFHIPYMIQDGGKDHTLPADLHAASVWNHMVSPRYELSLKTAGHFTYSDLCIFDIDAIDKALNIDATNVLGDGCGADNVSLDVAFPSIRSAAIGFFNVYLRESPASQEWLTQNIQSGMAPNEAVLKAEP